MKLSKSVVTASLLIAGSLAAFAESIPTQFNSSTLSVTRKDVSPVSATSTATQGLMSNDVDNFSDVNSWSDVEFDKLFGYFGYNNGYDIGLAGKVGSIYLAGYFNGNIGYTGSTTTTATVSGNSTTATADNSTSPYTWINTSVLVGINNIGIKAGVYYNDLTGEPYVVAPYISFGMSGIGSLNLTPHVTVSFSNYSNTVTSSSTLLGTTYTTTTYGGHSIFGLSAGTGLDLPSSGDFSQQLNIDMDLTVVNYPGTYSQTVTETSSATTTTTVVYKGKSAVAFELSPVYDVTYSHDKLGVALEVGLPIGFGSYSTGKTDGDSTGAYNSWGYFEFAPEFKLGVSYDIKSNVQAHGAVDFALPTVGVKTSEAVVDSSNSTATKTVYNDGDDASLTFSDGFTVTLNDQFSFDVSTKFMADIFGNDMTYSVNNSNDFWKEAGRVFWHDLTFTVFFKL